MLRAFIRRGRHTPLDVAHQRERMHVYEQGVPRAPVPTETIEKPLGGVRAVRISRPDMRPGRKILFLHGGAYYAGSPTLYRHISWRFAGAARAEFIAIEYRLAPEHPFPAALDDARAAWCALLGEGANPSHCAIMGDSAGGGLALALALRLRDSKQPLPGALVAISPWTDLAITGRSAQPPAADPMLYSEHLAEYAAQYLGGADPRDPYASPLHGDPRGLPPTLLQVGGDEILRDDSVRMAQKMREAGCNVTLEIWPRMPHVWHAFAPMMPEANRGIARVGAYIQQWTA
jgi:acetyl esterase/lipase